MTNPWNLSPRECEVLEQMARHGNQADAAAAMGISSKTVHAHLVNARRKLATHTIGAVVVWAKYIST